MRKLSCPACSFIAYASAGAVRRAGFPRCGCGAELLAPNLADRDAIEPDALERELLARGRVAFNDAQRALGRPEEIFREPERESRAPDRSRCQWPGGFCSRWTSGRYCAEHAAAGGAMAQLTPARRAL
jgi:hypothetical protein